MRIKRGLAAVISYALMMSVGCAAESGVVSTQIQQDVNITEHTEHGEHGNKPEMVGQSGIGKPMVWTTYPILKTKMAGESRMATVVTVIPKNIVANSIDAYSNNFKDEQAHRSLPLEMAGAKLDKPETGGFHWLSAREEQANNVHVASTVYYFGERGANNPTAMFMQPKNELEIIPQPYPREHSRYRANEDWKFLVRFNSQPLANQRLTLETSNGSKVDLLTDAAGVLNLHMPNDFKPMEEKRERAGHDHGMRRGADFVLATEHIDAGKTYLTAFNAGYGADAFDQRSLWMGLGFTLMGMASAVPLLRQRKQEVKKPTDAVPNKAEKEEA